MTKIAVLDDWQHAARASADWTPLLARADVEFFHVPFGSEDEAATKLAPFDVILATRERTPFPGSLVRRLPNLRMFGLTGSRAPLIHTAVMMERGVTVCYTGGGAGGAATAELALALMLAAARRIPALDAAARDGRFQQGTTPGALLAGKTVGIIGLGRIGARFARYCQALDMRVLAWSKNLTEDDAQVAGAHLVSKDELLITSDVVSLHLILSDRSRGILGAADLACMKPGAILVNTARAALVDEAALIKAVSSGKLIAALDVFHREPLPATDALTRLPNTVLTPHAGYGVREVYAEYYQHLIENALAFLNGKPIRVLHAPVR